MKKALILTAAAFALCGCFKVEEDQVFTEILFDAAAYKSASTKAGPIEGSFYGYDCPDFTVYLSYVAEGTWMAKHSESQFYAQATCKPDQENEIWRSTPVTYWPVSGSLTFVGFSPATIPTQFDNKNAILSCSNYNITSQEDIMYSVAEDADDLTVDSYTSSSAGEPDYTPDGTTNNKNTTGVPIIFRHALSQVLVNVNANGELNEDILFKVNSLSFKEQTMGTMTVKQDALKTLTWTLDGDASEAHNLITTATDIKNGVSFTSDSNSSKDGNQGFLVFPQSANTPKLVISYTQYQNTGLTQAQYNNLPDNIKADILVQDGKYWSAGGGRTDYEISLSTDTLKNFEAGKKYILNITLTAAKILYSPSITDWIDGGTVNNNL